MQQKSSNRRSFLQASAGSAAGLMLMSTKTALGAQANSKIQVGVLGCGGRGNFVTKKYIENAPDDIQVVAAQDPFADRLETMNIRYEIPKNRLYQGLEAHQELIDSDIDAVAVTSPPYFHPKQVEAAVKAGKHIWMAKPVAVDVHGCQSILESSKKAQGKQTFLVDFQTRNSPNFLEAVKRVHEGKIGDLVLGHIYYHAGRLGVKDKEGLSPDEFRLRNWVFDIELSGDIIVEQNVHVLDVSNWYVGAHPVKANGTGGRKARTDVGDCWDHFIVRYQYPNDILVDFSSAQFTKGYSDLCMRFYGSEGTVDAHYNGLVKITGDHPWPGTDHDDTWDSGVNNNVKDFVKSIRSGDYINHGEESVQSTLTGVLGRIAAYEGREVTWKEMMDNYHKPHKVKLDL